MSLSLAIALASAGPDADTTVRLARGSSIEISTTKQEIFLRTSSDDNLTVRGGGVRVGRGAAEVLEGNSGRGPQSLEIIVPMWAKVHIDNTNGNVTLDGTPARLDVET